MTDNLEQRLEEEKKRLIARLIISTFCFFLFLAFRAVNYLHHLPRYYGYIGIGCVVLATLIPPGGPRRRPPIPTTAVEELAPEWQVYLQQQQFGRYGTMLRVAYFLILLVMYLLKVKIL